MYTKNPSQIRRNNKLRLKKQQQRTGNKKGDEQKDASIKDYG